MKKIEVSSIITNAFSSDQALKLRDEMDKYLSNEEEVTLDFTDINKFTTLFFNFSTGYFISTLGRNKYDSLVKVINLSDFGQNTYKNSYNNAIRNDYKNATIKNEIISILENPDEL